MWPDGFLPALVYGLPLAGALAWHVRARHRREALGAAQLREAREAGLTEPPSLHPEIDLARCCGSGACASACPEGAIAIVGGRAVLANAAACIGHGACAAACPVQAITLVFGTERRGIDIPLVKPTFETNVPGIFIAGELGGMGLIRKAAEQGRQAVEQIARRPRGAAALDLVIVGAGPAGLAASLTAQSKGLRYATLEQEPDLGGSILHYPRRKIAMTAPVQLPLVGRAHMDRISKEELMAFWNRTVRDHRLAVRFGERMEEMASDGRGGFRVRTPRSTYEAPAVLLALGRRGTPRKLGVPGEECEKVVYRLLEPEQYAGRAVLVVGGGDSALEAALAVSAAPGADVVLSYRGESFNRVKAANRIRMEEAAGAGRLRVMLSSQVLGIERDRVSIDHEGTVLALRNDAVIVCAGGELPTPLLKRIGVMVETHHGRRPPADGAR